jgi:glycosyltransferase involved in cell wall biosynthesis
MKKAALLLPNLRSGGAERVMLQIAKGLLQQGYTVDIVLFANEGEFVKNIPEKVNIHYFFKSSKFLLLKMLVMGSVKYLVYLRNSSPNAVFSTLSKTNLFSIYISSFKKNRPRIIVREAATLLNIKNALIRRLIKWSYPKADKIVCVSNGIKSDLFDLGIKDEKLVVINNPVDINHIQSQSNIPPNHPWLHKKTEPVLLGIGRLTEQKGFDVLLRAFAIVQKTIPSKLIILGEGPLRQNLQNLSAKLGLMEKVDFHGYVDNPYIYLKNSDVFVLSSRWEGFVNVILESLALGTQVVATDCWSSPKEILQNGKLGRLVPINHPVSLANSIISSLRDPINSVELRKRASDFSGENILKAYIQLFENIENL